MEVTGGAESELKSASFFEFIRMGIMHIFTGVDHMSFLLGLVMISRRLKDLIFVVTGFTIGHSHHPGAGGDGGAAAARRVSSTPWWPSPSP